MTSKAAKRRANRRRAVITLQGMEPIPQTQPNDPKRDRPADARRGALEARLRVAGYPDTPDTLKGAVAPAFGDQVGLCIIAMIEAGEPTEAKRKARVAELWETYTRMAAARRLYRMRYLGTTGDPQNAAIAMQSDALMVDPDLRVDLRTAEERDEAVKRAEAHWTAQLNRIKVPHLRMALRSAVDGFNGPFWHDGKPTQAGRWAAEGLAHLAAEK